MASVTAVLAHWSTDEGVRKNWVWEEDPVSLPAILERLAAAQEAQGRTVLKLVRVFTRTAPLVDGEPRWAIAGPLRRVPEGAFWVTRGAGAGSALLVDTGTEPPGTGS